MSRHGCTELLVPIQGGGPGTEQGPPRFGESYLHHSDPASTFTCESHAVADPRCSTSFECSYENSASMDFPRALVHVRFMFARARRAGWADSSGIDFPDRQGIRSAGALSPPRDPRATRARPIAGGFADRETRRAGTRGRTRRRASAPCPPDRKSVV